MLPGGFTTPRLILRPIAASDSGPIFMTYARDPEVTRYLTWRPHRTRQDTDAYIADCLMDPPETERTYAVTGRQDGAVMGAFELRLPEPHRIEFGYVLARRWWGLGLMTEALREAAGWSLAQPPIFRIGSCCDVDNTGSARVMEKAGLVREGTLRRWLVHPNRGAEPRDCFIYGRSR